MLLAPIFIFNQALILSEILVENLLCACLLSVQAITVEKNKQSEKNVFKTLTPPATNQSMLTTRRCLTTVIYVQDYTHN